VGWRILYKLSRILASSPHVTVVLCLVVYFTTLSAVGCSSKQWDEIWQVRTVVTMKIASFWDVTPCSLVELHRRFGVNLPLRCRWHIYSNR
jgi:hypothetical protein